MLSLLMCKSAMETTLDKVTPEPTVRPTGGNKVHVYIRGHIWGWKSPSGSVCAFVCVFVRVFVCVCVCVRFALTSGAWEFLFCLDKHRCEEIFSV